MENDELNALLGQLAADAVVRDALLISLMELHPDLYGRLTSKVAVADLGVRAALPQRWLPSYLQRLREVKELMTQAHLPPGGKG